MVVIVFLFSFYKRIISPVIELFGVRCNYPITCSEYALRCLQVYGYRKGSVMAAKRLLTCHPFYRLGRE